MRDEGQVLFVPSEPDLMIPRKLRDAIGESDDNASTSVRGNIGSISGGACCQVEIHLQPNQKRCLLYSLDCNGQRKSSGGDEFYIRYEERIPKVSKSMDEEEDNIILQAVALITTAKDGIYELDFSTTPMFPSLYSVSHAPDQEHVISTWTVHFEYTNGIGLLPPPLKSHWQNGGYSHTTYQLKGHPSMLRPSCIREFRPPTPPAIGLNEFDQVFLFGDSTFCQFARQRPNKKGKYYFQPNLRVLGDKVRLGLNTKTVSELLQQLEESNIDGALSRVEGVRCKKRALIIGSCLWDILNSEDDIQGSCYDDHAQACSKYVRELRNRYPNVVIVWKSPMACHIHWVDLQRVVEHDRATATLFGINRIRYMSASRSRYLYELQKRIMSELDVPFIDLYEATYLSADQMYPSDGRHYRPNFNRKMIGWYYVQPTAEGSLSEEQTPKDYSQVSMY
ncbi:hypothetical protein IV203_008968 [Nitzschia inconspicua]|uniref:Uncharacterized protein n=1 Tax=Nitzschia inconspicua TaxID=303405 RepID=A0A9K3L172_9STRA|nr:hypothetical protein IV203_008968 [Nitzschia inconspicua]